MYHYQQISSIPSFDELMMMLGSAQNGSGSADCGLAAEELEQQPASLSELYTASCPSPASSTHTHEPSSSSSSYDESNDMDLMSQLDEMLELAASESKQSSPLPTAIVASTPTGFTFSHRLIATAPAVTTIAAAPVKPEPAVVSAVPAKTAATTFSSSSAVHAELKPAKAKDDKYSIEFPHAMLCYPYKYDIKFTGACLQGLEEQQLKLALVDAESFEIPQWPGTASQSKPIITVESIIPADDFVTIRFALHMCSFHYRKKPVPGAPAVIPASQTPFRLILVDSSSNSNIFTSVEFATYARKRVKNAALFEFGENNVVSASSAAGSGSDDSDIDDDVAPASKKQRLNESGRSQATKKSSGSGSAEKLAVPVVAAPAPAVAPVKVEKEKSLVSSVPTKKFFAQLGKQQQQAQSQQASPVPVASPVPAPAPTSMAAVPAQYALAVFQTQLQHYWIDPNSTAVNQDMELKASLERTSQAVQLLRNLSPLELQAAMLNCQLLASFAPSK